MARIAEVLAAVAVAGGLAACGGGGGHGGGFFPPPNPGQAKLTCDETMKTRFAPALTQVLLVKAVKTGDPLLLSGSPGTDTPVATSDVCVVKLLVGPGNPGPADAPSTSRGIGIEIWLPTSTNFINATRNGADRWTTLSYLGLSNAYDRGVTLQTSFANINTDDNNLAEFAARGGKMLVYHGLADTLIPPQGTLNYYNRLTAKMGGDTVVRNFYRLFLVPGMAHGFSNGTANPDANPPLPTIDQLYLALTTWVEQDQPPSRLDIASPVTTTHPSASSRPICMHPTKAAFVGTDPLVAASYNCT